MIGFKANLAGPPTQCTYLDGPYRCVLDREHAGPCESYTFWGVDIRLPLYRWNDYNKRQIRLKEASYG